MRYTAWLGSEGKTCGHTHRHLEHASKCASHMGGEVRQAETKAGLQNFDLERGPGMKVDDNQISSGQDSMPKAATPKSQFSVSKRFDMLSKITEMVIQGYQRSELIVGCGGTGKTKTIMDQIKAQGLKEVDVVPTGEEGEELDQNEGNGSFIKISGATSPTGLYRVLYENADATIVMDDCDGFLANDAAVNILKTVLDTSGDGVVSWNSPAITKMDLPTSFQFRGRMIFISNKKINQVPQPLLSRSLVLDMDMNNSEIIDRARMLGDNLLPKLDEQQRKELFDFVEENADTLRDVSLRTFVLAEPYIAAGFDDWKDMVLFSA